MENSGDRQELVEQNNNSQLLPYTKRGEKKVSTSLKRKSESLQWTILSKRQPRNLEFITLQSLDGSRNQKNRTNVPILEIFSERKVMKCEIDMKLCILLLLFSLIFILQFLLKSKIHPFLNEVKPSQSKVECSSSRC